MVHDAVLGCLSRVVHTVCFHAGDEQGDEGGNGRRMGDLRLWVLI